MDPKVCVLRTDGTNCHRETKYAFELVGAEADIVHLNTLKKGYDPASGRNITLADYNILALVGGFSHGDYAGAGRIQAFELMHSLGDQVDQFIADRKLIIGICNGFQVLVKSGLLPGFAAQEGQIVTLTYNDSGKFECRPSRLYKPAGEEERCVWTLGIDAMDIPVAHAEGKFVAPRSVVRRLFDQGQVVFLYGDIDHDPARRFPDNPNGSVENIAGICDPTGRIFGLMPHPERYNHPKNHHLATLQEILSRDYVDKDDPAIQERLRIAGECPDEGLGLKIFRNGVEYVRDYLFL